jgi:uncharacterized membrane protein
MQTQEIRGNGETRRAERAAATNDDQATDDELRASDGRRDRAESTRRSGRVGLGLFSLGLGLTELAAAPQLSKWLLGAENRRTRGTLRALGVREIASGLGLLAGGRPTGWLWSRVVGDAMDLGLLALAFTGKRARMAPIATASAAVLGVAALDVWAAQRSRRSRQAPAPVRVTGAITVGRSVEDVYRFWRVLPNLARFMGQVEAVDQSDDRRSHWRLKGRGGRLVEWDAELTEDRPNECIGWKTVANAPLFHQGEVRFAPAPGGQGTQITWTAEYRVPGGELGSVLGHLMDKVPEVQMQNDLRRCKQLLELGEVVHSDASIARGMHAARPSARKGGAR